MGNGTSKPVEPPPEWKSHGMQGGTFRVISPTSDVSDPSMLRRNPSFLSSNPPPARVRKGEPSSNSLRRQTSKVVTHDIPNQARNRGIPAPSGFYFPTKESETHVERDLISKAKLQQQESQSFQQENTSSTRPLLHKTKRTLRKTTKRLSSCWGDSKMEKIEEEAAVEASKTKLRKLPDKPEPAAAKNVPLSSGEGNRGGKENKVPLKPALRKSSKSKLLTTGKVTVPNQGLYSSLKFKPILKEVEGAINSPHWQEEGLERTGRLPAQMKDILPTPKEEQFPLFQKKDALHQEDIYFDRLAAISSNGVDPSPALIVNQTKTHPRTNKVEQYSAHVNWDDSHDASIESPVASLFGYMSNTLQNNDPNDRNTDFGKKLDLSVASVDDSAMNNESMDDLLADEPSFDMPIMRRSNSMLIVDTPRNQSAEKDTLQLRLHEPIDSLSGGKAPQARILSSHEDVQRSSRTDDISVPHVAKNGAGKTEINEEQLQDSKGQHSDQTSPKSVSGSDSDSTCSTKTLERAARVASDPTSPDNSSKLSRQTQLDSDRSCQTDSSWSHNKSTSGQSIGLIDHTSATEEGSLKESYFQNPAHLRSPDAETTGSSSSQSKQQSTDQVRNSIGSKSTLEGDSRNNGDLADDQAPQKTIPNEGQSLQMILGVHPSYPFKSIYSSTDGDQDSNASALRTTPDPRKDSIGSADIGRYLRELEQGTPARPNKMTEASDYRQIALGNMFGNQGVPLALQKARRGIPQYSPAADSVASTPSTTSPGPTLENQVVCNAAFLFSPSYAGADAKLLQHPTRSREPSFSISTCGSRSRLLPMNKKMITIPISSSHSVLSRKSEGSNQRRVRFSGAATLIEVTKPESIHQGTPKEVLVRPGKPDVSGDEIHVPNVVNYDQSGSLEPSTVATGMPKIESKFSDLSDTFSRATLDPNSSLKTANFRHDDYKKSIEGQAREHEASAFDRRGSEGSVINDDVSFEPKTPARLSHLGYEEHEHLDDASVCKATDDASISGNSVSDVSVGNGEEKPPQQLLHWSYCSEGTSAVTPARARGKPITNATKSPFLRFRAAKTMFSSKKTLARRTPPKNMKHKGKGGSLVAARVTEINGRVSLLRKSFSRKLSSGQVGFVPPRAKVIFPLRNPINVSKISGPEKIQQSASIILRRPQNRSTDNSLPPEPVNVPSSYEYPSQINRVSDSKDSRSKIEPKSPKPNGAQVQSPTPEPALNPSIQGTHPYDEVLTNSSPSGGSVISDASRSRLEAHNDQVSVRANDGRGVGSSTGVQHPVMQDVSMSSEEDAFAEILRSPCDDEIPSSLRGATLAGTQEQRYSLVSDSTRSETSNAGIFKKPSFQYSVGGSSTSLRSDASTTLSSILGKENTMNSFRTTKGMVKPTELHQHTHPGSLHLSPVQRTPMQARKWRDLAAAAHQKDGKSSSQGNRRSASNLFRRGLSERSANIPAGY